jgi:aromatic-L-amino-acid decarboxylase
VPLALAGDEAALAHHNAALLARVNATGTVHLTHTTLAGKYAIRVAIGSMRTQARHVEELWGLIREAVRHPDT